MDATKATPEGTLRLKRRFVEGGKIAAGHYRYFEGLYLSSLGLGTYLGEPDDRTDQLVEQALKVSVDQGAISVIDTAINYRFQKAERSVGKALRDLFKEGKIGRDEIFVCTKNGYLTHDGDLDFDFWPYLQTYLVKPGVISAEDIVDQHCMTVPYLRDQLERSLNNLGVQCVDLMYLHNPAESQLAEIGREEFFERLRAAFEFYENERKKGKIQFYGLATWNCFRVPQDHPEYLSLREIVGIANEVAVGPSGFRFIQLPFNLAMPEAYTLRNQPVGDEHLSILEAAEKLKIGVFISAPLLQGQLLPHVKVPKLPLVDSPALYCLQFARSAPGVVAALVGQKEPTHVEENLKITNVPPYALDEFLSIFFSRRPKDT